MTAPATKVMTSTPTKHHPQHQSRRPLPDTILVVRMTTGSYLFVGYPQAGPAALVVQDDAGPLRQVLAAAFGLGHTTEAHTAHQLPAVRGDGRQTPAQEPTGTTTLTAPPSRSH
jgi:hypothetical protein